MDIRHLELLRELAERGSVTAVARATHRTPSAVSQQLQVAQRDAGVPLVEQAGRGLRLTDAGRVVAEGGREVAHTLAVVQARWDEFRGQPAGTVSVAALPSAATFLLPGVMADLVDSAIDLVCDDVDVSESSYGALTADHDIVLAHSLSSLAPAGAEGLVTRLLVREPLDIATRHGHVLSADERVEPADLVQHEWYGVPLGYPFDSVRIAVEEATGSPVTVVQRLRDNRLVEALVADSDRIAVLPRFTTPGERIALRPVRGLPTARYIFAMARPDRAERLAVRRVLAAFTAVAAGIDGS